MQNGTSLWAPNDINYIKDVISNRAVMFNEFIANNPDLTKDLEHRDVQLQLVDVIDNNVYFSFDDINAKVILAKDGVFLNNEKFDTLAK